ncbi:MAG: alanine--tRNA ligase, partial [Myxococcales bacterium]|nr:alanine--tRNA ligase [Myxococcales bacterium]
AVEREVERRQASGQDAELGAGKAVEDAYFRVKEAHGATRFLGYGALEAEAVVQAILREGQPVSEASAGETVEIICDQTPFYAESGGQVGDTGELTGERLAVTVTDTRKPTELHVHHGVIEVGRVHVGQKVTLTVDKERRDAIRRNHSATHLLHHALREVLGPHVVQKGSLVAPDRLRFDFSHARPMTADQRREVELHVNRAALQNLPSSTRLMSPADARHVGAIGL